MELAWFEDLGALILAGNFSRAASARCITQPAFSRRIRGLQSPSAEASWRRAAA